MHEKNLSDEGLLYRIYKELYNLIIKDQQLNLKWTEDLNSFPGKIFNVQNVHKRCSVLLVREMQIKSTMKCHFAPLRKLYTKENLENKKYW